MSQPTVVAQDDGRYELGGVPFQGWGTNYAKHDARIITKFFAPSSFTTNAYLDCKPTEHGTLVSTWLNNSDHSVVFTIWQKGNNNALSLNATNCPNRSAWSTYGDGGVMINDTFYWGDEANGIPLNNASDANFKFKSLHANFVEVTLDKLIDQTALGHRSQYISANGTPIVCTGLARLAIAIDTIDRVGLTISNGTVTQCTMFSRYW